MYMPVVVVIVVIVVIVYVVVYVRCGHRRRIVQRSDGERRYSAILLGQRSWLVGELSQRGRPVLPPLQGHEGVCAVL